ncbi:MAG: hypothetical protein ABUT20_56835, partial [Bacteroidota bacterium]
TGNIFCYINSDDQLLPDALEKVNARFLSADYDLVFGDANYISETGELLYKYNAINLPQGAIRYIKRLPFAQQSAFWTRKIYLETGGFDDSLKYVADSKFFLTVYLRQGIRTSHIHSVLGEFRVHRDSFSVKAFKAMENESKKMLYEVKGLKTNTAAKYFWEFFTKIINIKAIYKKKTYHLRHSL